MTTKPKASTPKKVAAKKSGSIVEEELQKSVGVRELRQHASRVLELVKNGEVITVTDRGVPIAEITPIKKTKYQVLLESGAITPALRAWDPSIWEDREGPTYPDALAEFLKERHEARY